MLEYVSTNYVWNLSTNLALMMRGNIGEIDSICRQLVDASKRGDDDGTEAFFRIWGEQADRLVELAEEDLAKSRRLSAGAKHGRASTYYLTAERMQHRDYAPRAVMFQKMLASFAKFVDLHEENCERVEIPYAGTRFAGLFVKATTGGAKRAPCMALFNGLDSAKEMIYGSGIQQGDRPVPHYWDHVQWVFGKKTLDEFMAFAPRMTLAPVSDEITVPFLITHGSNDRQIPQECAHQQYEGAVNSPKRELKFFTPREGGVEHVSADNQDNARDYIADWVAETFAELGAEGVRT